MKQKFHLRPMSSCNRFLLNETSVVLLAGWKCSSLITEPHSLKSSYVTLIDLTSRFTVDGLLGTS